VENGQRVKVQSDLKTRSPSFEHVERHVAALFTANPRADPMSMRKPNFLNTPKATLPTKGQTFTHLHLPHGDERLEKRITRWLKYEKYLQHYETVLAAKGSRF
jgi:hypothetical protein